ncbi:hypothetical protein P8452_61577 [Trifolium repens]|nr:hypothetical protein P8452_61577 [Trifolium repens]
MKKLSFIQSQSPSSRNKRKFETPGKSGSGKSCLASPPSTRGVKKPRRSRLLSPAGSGVPKNFKCKFHPTVDMKLTPEDAKINELVYSVGNHFGIQSEFESFIPGGYIGRSIIKMVALRITWNQVNGCVKNMWCLPPLFAMHAFEKLKLIYVPIEEEESGHVEERKICHLDSYLVEDKVDARQQIRKIARALSNLILEIYNSNMHFCLLPDFGHWNIVEPRGVPNCGNSENVGLWVAEWMNMQSNFNSQILEERRVRMRTAVRLLLGPQNACRNKLEEKAEEYWDKKYDER